MSRATVGVHKAWGFQRCQEPDIAPEIRLREELLVPLIFPISWAMGRPRNKFEQEGIADLILGSSSGEEPLH